MGPLGGLKTPFAWFDYTVPRGAASLVTHELSCQAREPASFAAGYPLTLPS